jgi:L-alanine-DL-glutamate epimerase-like enolase superfamily enzyme
MKITAIRLERLRGSVEHTGQFRLAREDRLGMPIDVYDEFKAVGPPPPQPLFERDESSGRYIMKTGVLSIETDEGVTGLCFGAGDSGELRRIAETIIGEDPLATERIWDILFRKLLGLTPGSIMHKMAVVDVALWDLKSKALGVPVVTLLGGPARARVQAYAMARDYSKDPSKIGDHARDIVSQGFRAMKWYPRFGPTDGREGMAKNEAFVAACREAIGPEVDIILDCWKTWSVPYAIEMARRLEPYRLRWIEEPVFQYKAEQYAEIRRAVNSTQISGGEQLYALWEFKRLFDHAAVDIAQPDPMWCGGITNIMKIITLAQAYDVAVIMHVVQLPVNIQISAALNAMVCPLIEYPTYQGQFTGQYFLKRKIIAENGYVSVPMEPGIFEIDESVVEEREEIFHIEAS